MKKKIIAILTTLICVFIIAPQGVFAASDTSDISDSDIEISGWIPFWRAKQGAKNARSHLSDLSATHPFGYSVQKDGTLKDLIGMKKSEMRKLIKSADSKNVSVVPTVMWSDGATIHEILSNPESRKRHIAEIVEMVEKGKYDGVDIDYEGKWADTKDFYSAFLKELKVLLDEKELSCTIEARTPPDSLYTVVPGTIQYSNDYAAINRYCDRVNIMTYDQGRADIKLDNARRGAPYIPVADIDWVRKVVELAVKSIDKDKIVLGVASYGYEYEVAVSPNWFQGYTKLWSFSPNYAEDLADDYDFEPSRNAAGEMSLSYIPKKSKFKLPKSISAPKDTPPGNVIAARMLAYANETGETVAFNLAWWSDAEAIAQKADLARELGLRGIALFRIDGAEDKRVWEEVKGNK